MLKYQYARAFSSDWLGQLGLGEGETRNLAADCRDRSGKLLRDSPSGAFRLRIIFGFILSRLALRVIPAACVVVLAGAAAGTVQADAGQPEPAFTPEKGLASFYGRSHQGRRTASGQRFDPKQLTAAHPWLPFGTRVRVTAENGLSVVVTITDRLPARRRIVDLSYGAAALLGMVSQGVAMVSLTPG